MSKDEALRREITARAAIEQSFGTGENESGADLFASHHLEEIERANTGRSTLEQPDRSRFEFSISSSYARIGETMTIMVWMSLTFLFRMTSQTM